MNLRIQTKPRLEVWGVLRDPVFNKEVKGYAYARCATPRRTGEKIISIGSCHHTHIVACRTELTEVGFRKAGVPCVPSGTAKIPLTPAIISHPFYPTSGGIKGRLEGLVPPGFRAR